MQPKKDIEALSLIGARLSAERRRLDLTQEDLALRGGVKRQTQAHYEKGSRAPDGSYLAAIAEVGVDILYVLVGRRERRPLDHDLLVNALLVVDEQLQKLGIELHPEIKARAIVQLYITFEGKSAVDPDVAEALIKFASDASRPLR